MGCSYQPSTLENDFNLNNIEFTFEGKVFQKEFIKNIKSDYTPLMFTEKFINNLINTFKL